jgi:hypothetical protein
MKAKENATVSPGAFGRRTTVSKPS